MAKKEKGKEKNMKNYDIKKKVGNGYARYYGGNGSKGLLRDEVLYATGRNSNGCMKYQQDFLVKNAKKHIKKGDFNKTQFIKSCKNNLDWVAKDPNVYGYRYGKESVVDPEVRWAVADVLSKKLSAKSYRQLNSKRGK